MSSAIRQAELSDLDALLAIETSSFSGDRLNRRCMRAWLNRPHGLMPVICLDGRIAGYLLLIHHPGKAWGRIYSLAVDGACRGQGLGRRLLAAAEELARTRDCRELRLEVSVINQAACELYRSSGYRIFGTYPSYYEDDSDALRMRKRLVVDDAATPPCEPTPC
jgi:ribosomal protein S18 acetylase RimI-like enzyme